MFKFLFGKSNPTHQFPPANVESLTVDLNAGALNDCKLGQRLESLAFLGPDEDKRSYQDHEFRYYSAGLCIECEGAEFHIRAYHIVLRDPQERRFKSFNGHVTYNGGRVDLPAITPDNCTEVLGDYYWMDRDEDESLVFYEFDGQEWQLEFDDRGSLQRLIMTDRPLLANQEQRRNYNVTKPWPPRK